jgi:hypothetical protein
MTGKARIAITAACVAAVATLIGFTAPAEAGNRQRPEHRYDQRYDGCEWVYERFGSRAGYHRNHYRRFLRPREVARALRGQGFYRLRYVDFRYGLYTAVAKGHRHRPLRLYVHPRNGRVLCAAPLRGHVHGGRRPIEWRDGRDHSRVDEVGQRGDDDRARTDDRRRRRR